MSTPNDDEELGAHRKQVRLWEAEEKEASANAQAKLTAAIEAFGAAAMVDDRKVLEETRVAIHEYLDATLDIKYVFTRRLMELAGK